MTIPKRRIPPWLWRLLAVMVVSQTAIFIIRPVLTYRALDLHAGDVYVGLLVAAYAVLPAALAIPLGRYSDRNRPGRVLRVGVALLVLGGAGLTFAPDLVALMAATVVLGLGAMAVMIGSQALVARIGREDDLDRDFGLISAAASVGQMVGPFLAGVIVVDGVSREITTMAAFAVGSAMCVLALAGSWRYPDLRPSTVAAEDTPSWGETIGILRRPGVLGGMLASLTLLTTVDLLVAYLPLIGERTGISPVVIGVLLSLRAAASVLSRILIPVLVRSFGRAQLIVASTLGTGLLVATMPLLGEVWVMGAVLVLVGLFLGLGQPLTMSLIAQAVPGPIRGAALSIRMMGNKAGQVALPAVIAVSSAALGVVWAFVILGGILVATSFGVRPVPPAAPGDRP